jgi:hypothetical protein
VVCVDDGERAGGTAERIEELGLGVGIRAAGRACAAFNAVDPSAVRITRTVGEDIIELNDRVE